jgi:hypothetical protein
MAGMIAVFVRRINAGIITVDEVPALWKADVEKVLEEQKSEEEQEV